MTKEPNESGPAEESTENSDDLSKKFKELSLNPKKWLKVFQDRGVKSAKTLELMGMEDYSLLKVHAKKPWERKALQKLLNIQDSQVSSKELRDEETKQKTKQENKVKAKKEMEETKKMMMEAKRRLGEGDELKAATLQKAKETRVGSSRPLRESLEGKIEKLLTVKDEVPQSNDSNLSAEGILLNASGGLALEGIYLTMNQEDTLKKREQLLAVPKGISLTASQQSPELKQREFSSSVAESTFRKSMEKLGYTIATAAKGGFWGFQAEASFGYNSINVSKQKHESHTECTYISTTKYNYIPLAACYINKELLQLSPPALSELRKIEELEKHCNVAKKANLLKEKYGTFFKRFGSHANQGPLQFGGIFWWTATSQGFKQEMIEEMKSKTSNALNASFSLSYSGLWSAAGSADVERTEAKVSSNKEEKTLLQTDIQLFVTKTGGPSTVDSLKEWKLGLEANKKTWSVIDRGSSVTPVWEIILSSHMEDFKDAYQVAKNLKDFYVAITDQHQSFQMGDKLSTAIYEANHFLSKIKSWDVNSAVKQLTKLIEFRQHLNEKTGDFNVWLNVCLPHEELRGFLSKVMESYKQNTKSDENMVHSQLKLILQNFTYSSENVDDYLPILKWLYPSKNEQNTNISDFSTFIEFISRAKDDLLRFCSNDESEESVWNARLKATRILNFYVSSFLKTLRCVGQTEEELLVLCAVSTVDYSMQGNYFQHSLEWEEVNFLVEEMRHLFEEYKNLKDIQVYRAQAFILAAGLTAGDKKNPKSIEQKKEFLQLILGKMESSFEWEIQNTLEKYRRFNNLQSFIVDLNLLISGNSKSVIDGNTENLVKEIKTVCLVTNQSPTIECQGQVTVTVQNDGMNPNQDVKNLVVKLGIENYFPKGLGRRSFHVVHTSVLNRTQTERDLPQQFMQMLMKLDYRFRYLTCKNNLESVNLEDSCNPELEISEFDTIEDLLNSCSSEKESPTVSTERETIHPMDLLMSIYHCSDDFMRQYTFTKLSTCQFALPFIVPRPYDSQIELPLWAFRQVQKSILDTEKLKHQEKFVCQIDVPVVCFTRLGTSQYSKSHILNNLLSKHRHDIFFHRNCDGSVKNRILMDGVAEIFWYCPGGKDTDQFEKCTAFVNLRGDIRDHKKQAAFLQEISSINIIMLSQSDLNDFKKVMTTGQLNKKPLIILLPEKETSTNVQRESSQVLIGLKNQNKAKVLDDLTKSIRRLLASSGKTCSLEACAKIGRQHGFLVDEDSPECTEGKHHASLLLSHLKQNDLMKSKEELLPLSGQLWHSWCQKDKELTRLSNKNESIEQHCSKIETDKNSIRQTQLQKGSQNHFIKDFITKLKMLSSTSKLFFLQWFKISIDNLSCDRMLELREEYNMIWTQLQSEQLDNDELVKNLQDNLEGLSNQMNANMFGLEHVLREVGQTYETLHDLQQTDECFSELPKMAADMMNSGYPIELMDGDACYVPLKWIKAVLNELIKIIGDKKIFVLSVLGVQSSGKSTLLNTMFGLQFAVSAGRCTRGAFMQLIEIVDELKDELGFEYILVIDTEGLRAMELSNQSTLNHDNELATFVIGVGNTTLINVFGENPSEIKDILQIAVQAFLRMNQVKLSSSCLFVHQNVGDLTALDKNMEGRRNLQKELDKMTELAAKQELCNVQRFSEVIRFDPKDHIQYFSHLWEGNPPMAPPNPHYSEDAQKVRDMIIHPKQGYPHGILSISDFITRTEDLWLALRNENFVFSFKNTLEISAYSKVENRYQKLTWELRRHFLELQAKLNSSIKKGNIAQITRNYIENKVNEKFCFVKEEFENFFNDDKDKELLIQWKSNIENRLNNLYNELIQDTKRQGTEYLRLRNSQIQEKERHSDYEEELFMKSKQLALDIKDQGLKESEMRDQFSILWQAWIAEINNSTSQVPEPNIISDAENIILEYFKHEPSMNEKLQNFSRWTVFSLDLTKHVLLNKKFFGSYKIVESDKMNIIKVFSNLDMKVEEFLVEKQKKRVDYTPTYFHAVINEVSEEMKRIDSSKKFPKFTLTKLFKFDVSLYLCGKAVPIFRTMHETFQQANNPVRILECKREEFFSCFTISCQGAASIKIFADLLCSKLLEAIQLALYNRTALAIVDEMTCNYPAFSGNRAKLETYILIDLAEQEDFEQYREYIHFPEKFFNGFIKKCVENYCLDDVSNKLKNFLHISLDHFQKVILSSISESTKLVKNTNGNVSDWLDDFYERVEDIVEFSRADLKGIEHQEIQDIEFIQEAMCNAWDTAIDTMKKDLKTKTFDDFETKPHDILTKQLCGCWEQCPFCRAICTNTVAGHDGDHCVPFHRPQAITGISWDRTEEFVIEICSTLVNSEHCFVIDRTTQIPYKQYRKIGPSYATWSITPDTSSQPYWKWYVGHFQTKLENDYGLKFQNRGKIPAEWEAITKNEVIAKLKEQI